MKWPRPRSIEDIRNEYEAYRAKLLHQNLENGRYVLVDIYYPPSERVQAWQVRLNCGHVFDTAHQGRGDSLNQPKLRARFYCPECFNEFCNADHEAWESMNEHIEHAPCDQEGYIDKSAAGYPSWAKSFEALRARASSFDTQQFFSRTWTITNARLLGPLVKPPAKENRRSQTPPDTRTRAQLLEEIRRLEERLNQPKTP